ncbi:NTP transferase domain-containing protein [Actibacterium mucosum]|uniref:NTP transferase domain-containing protein n=1 Tax=Actibacterium mucosum TaxID=1087332 RepID=UPI0005568093|nr:molybdopterin-binding/glycosyltransferase family 2 protein [Actibacterium mucosum]
MKFGPVPTDQALGAVLAHGLRAGRVFKKGRVLDQRDIDDLLAAGVAQVTVARLDPGDVAEDAAAQSLATALAGDGIRAEAPFTGRVNLVAARDGLFTVDTETLTALNAVDEAISLATLPHAHRVTAGTLLATVKIIPYALPGAALRGAMNAVQAPPLAVRGNRVKSAALILTETPGFKPSLLTKAQDVTRARLTRLGVDLNQVQTVPHRTDDVAAALTRTAADLTLIFGASATSDRGDVAPAAVEQAGGAITRFGMPVDPGNLLFTGTLNGAPVIGLPGCARSPALNGADWVLERIVAGLSITTGDIAAMGVGGLLKEIPQRAQPRRAPLQAQSGVAILLLAAGRARRMRGQDKLTRQVDGEALLHRAARIAVAADTGAETRVVLPKGHTARRAALGDLPVAVTETEDWAEGMAGSLRAGLADIPADAAGVIVALADMPEVTTDHFRALTAAFDPDTGAEICRSVAADGTRGHPVLFSRRFFEALSALRGDTGAREVLRAASEMVVDVPTPGQGAVTDLDTPEAWAAWEAGRD